MRDGENRDSRIKWNSQYDLTGEQQARCFPPQEEWSDTVAVNYGGDKIYVPRKYEGCYSKWPPLVNPVHRKAYVVGSLANPEIPKIAQHLRRELGWEVFDDWHAAHPEADSQWRAYEVARGRSYEEALRAPAGQNVYNFDLGHLNTSTHGLLALPAGRSGHLELGYLAGRGASTAILLDADYDRWDVMYAFADIVTKDIEEIIEKWRE